MTSPQLGIVLAFVNIWGGLIFGYNTGIIATALDPLKKTFQLTPFLEGLATSCILLGAAVGSVCGGFLADRIGRKKVMLILSLVCVVGTVALAWSPNFPILVTVRAVLGIGVGLSSVVCPMYVAEMSAPEKRGILGSLFQLSITAGILIAYIVGYFLTNPQLSVDGWRVMFGLGIVPALVMLFLALFFVHESYQWLHSKKDITSSQMSGGDETTPINIPTSEVAEGNQQLTGIRGLFSLPNLKTLLVGIALAITLQLTGINAIIFFAPQILRKTALQQDPLILTIVIGAWNFGTTLLSVLLNLVDRLGRRKLWLIGLAILTVSNFVVAVSFLSWLPSNVTGWVALVGIATFILAFAMSTGILFWILIAEIFPSGVRDYGVAFLNVLQWSFNLLLSTVFSELLDKVGAFATFASFGVIGGLVFFFLLFTLPETINAED
jgi:sugar porter (SP) family MFS transporter